MSLVDVLGYVNPNPIKCLDKGIVELIDVMPRYVPGDKKTADYAVVQAARVSTGQGMKSEEEDRALIRYLMRHEHSSPLEQVEFKLYMKLPIFVARQMVRHRTVSLNEVSGRYTELKDEFFVPNPEDVTIQSGLNKQGGDEKLVENADYIVESMRDTAVGCFDAYTSYLEHNVRKELARINLPLSTYTEWYFKVDLRNLLHFLGLRCDSHAQKEIRVYADAMLALIKPIVPWCVEAWEDYHHLRGAIKLSRLEVEALRGLLSRITLISPKLVSGNRREQKEWEEKAKKLGLSVEGDG